MVYCAQTDTPPSITTGVFHDIAKPSAYSVGAAVPAFDLVGEDVQLGQQNARLQRVQARIHADAVIGVAGFALAVIAQRFDQMRQLFVIGQHGAAIAITAQRLGRIEADGGDVRPGDRMLTVQRAAEALRTVGDQLEAMGFGQGSNGGIIGGLPEQIDGDDRLRGQPGSAAPSRSPPPSSSGSMQ
jgi:hypothetical protein